MINGDDLGAYLALIKSGILAGFGGLVGHIMDVTHRKIEFSWPSFLAAVLVAFFVGQVLGNWLPIGTPGRDGVLMVAGTSAYPMLALLQDKVTKLIKRLF